MKKLNVNVNGNKKLVNNEHVKYMIWNLPAVATCPFRTEHCEKSCYARKAERVYPTCLPSREKNYSDSLENDFVENMIFTIEKELNSKKYKDKLCVFRVHESGDFYDLEYTEKWVKIWKHFEDDNRIIFSVYTKSIIYFINCGYGLSNFPQNVVIRSSLWDDTRKDLVELTYTYHFPIYTALTAEDMETEKENGRKFSKCRCSDCGNCLKCIRSNIKEIICEIH